MLIGGGGVVALAAGGGYWFFLRGPSGAKAVVDDYYDAVDSYDEAALKDIYHEDSPRWQSLDEDGIDALFFQTDEYFQTVSISVEGLFEMDHETDFENATPPFNPAQVDVDEYKEILAVVRVDESGWEQAEEQATEDDDLVRKSTNTHTVVRTEGDSWKLWS